MLRYLPLIIAAVVAVPLTLYEGGISDRWNPVNTQAIQCAMLLDEIPMEIDGPDGLWVGKDMYVDEKVRKTAGAEGYVSRYYQNQNTNEAVSVWFIVGHFRNIIRHTPNICYRAQGAKQIDEDVVRYPLGPVAATPVDEEAQRMDGFFTTKFGRSDVLGGWERVERVYWAWWEPKPLAAGETLDPAQIRWVAPDAPRRAFAYPRALYKLYFTVATSPEADANNETVIKFANLFIPIANEAIAKSGAVMNQTIDDDAVAARNEEIKAKSEVLKKEYEDAVAAQKKAARA